MLVSSLAPAAGSCRTCTAKCSQRNVWDKSLKKASSAKQVECLDLFVLFRHFPTVIQNCAQDNKLLIEKLGHVMPNYPHYMSHSNLGLALERQYLVLLS